MQQPVLQWLIGFQLHHMHSTWPSTAEMWTNLILGSVQSPPILMPLSGNKTFLGIKPPQKEENNWKLTFNYMVADK